MLVHIRWLPMHHTNRLQSRPRTGLQPPNGDGRCSALLSHLAARSTAGLALCGWHHPCNCRPQLVK